MAANKGTSDSAKFYQKNKASREAKKRYDTEFGKKKEQREKRAELGRANRAADKKGVDRKNKDLDHATGRYVKSSINRGRNSVNSSKTQPGDRSSRNPGVKKSRSKK